MNKRTAKSEERGAAVAKPATRNAERTKNKILRVATSEFSTHGFDGARVDRIAARCQISKYTLYYHFKSKDGLIVAVLERMYTRLRDRQEEQPIPLDHPVEAMQRIVEQTFSAFTDNPEIIILLNEENLHKARHLKNFGQLKELYDPLVDKISQVLHKGAERGVFRPDLDPVAVYITISSLAYHFISNSYTLQLALGKDFASPSAYKNWVAHINDVVLTYCQGLRDAPVQLQRPPRTLVAG